MHRILWAEWPLESFQVWKPSCRPIRDRPSRSWVPKPADGAGSPPCAAPSLRGGSILRIQVIACQSEITSMIPSLSIMVGRVSERRGHLRLCRSTGTPWDRVPSCSSGILAVQSAFVDGLFTDIALPAPTSAKPQWTSPRPGGNCKAVRFRDLLRCVRGDSHAG